MSNGAEQPPLPHARELSLRVRDLLRSLGASEEEVHAVLPRKNLRCEPFVYWGSLSTTVTERLLRLLADRTEREPAENPADAS
ncbi:MAG: hypothetical protein HOY69_37410 [Streptomyces sp.]|nr:hypothetical protein [Streptomyces sp.]